MTTPLLRLATPHDAAPLAAFAERCFRDTFGPDNTPANMDLHCAASYGEALQRAELEDPGVVTLLLDDAGTLAGYCQMRLAVGHDGVPHSDVAEIRRFYVDRSRIGGGLAQRLMAASRDELARRGVRTVWLAVWERNPRAIRFYEKCGFRPVGRTTFLLGDDTQFDIVVECPIAELLGG